MAPNSSMRDRRSPMPRGRPEGQRTEKNRASADSNTLEDQCHPRKIFIGGLAHKTTTQHLRDNFGRFGSIVDAVVLRWPDGRSRGFGYVTFADSSAAASVLKETHSLSGREVDVKRAVPGTNKLFIGGLPQNTTATELREHFEKFGVVSDAVVMIDPATSRSRGFGFVCFLPGQEGATAVTNTLQQYDNHRMRGKWIEVKSAAPPYKLAASAKAKEGPSYEELALSGALQMNNPDPSPSPSIENRQPNQQKRNAPALGSPRKVALPASTDLGRSALQAAPQLAAPISPSEFSRREVASQLPWWSSQPWPQPFGAGFAYGLGLGASSFSHPAHAPFGFESAPPSFRPDYFHTPPYADQSGLEQFLRQSVQHKMEWEAHKGTAQDPSTTASSPAAASETEAQCDSVAFFEL